MEYEVTPQRQAYLDARGYTILSACPGSGKTTSIVRKLLAVSRFCHEQYGAHTGFACLSFTNKACAELKQKYRVMHEERLTFPNEVLTIDSFIMQYVVLPFWYLCDVCKKKPIIVNEVEVLERIHFNNVLVKGTWRTFVAPQLRQYSDIVHRKTPAKVSRSKNGFFWNHNEVTNDREAAYCEAVFTYRLGKGFITSSDALWMACNILEHHQNIAKALVTRFPYIIVDEAQDNSELHFEFFKLLKEAMLPEIDIVQMYYRNQLSNGTVYNYDKEYRPKLYKRLRQFEWIEPVHEMVQLDPVIYDSEIEIDHMPLSNHSRRDFGLFVNYFRKNKRLSKRLHHMYTMELYISYQDESFLEAIDICEATMNDPTRSMDELKEVFVKAEASDFMKGINDRKWMATFDWMMNDNNMAKILDGNYDNKGAVKKDNGRVDNSLNVFE